MTHEKQIWITDDSQLSLTKTQNILKAAGYHNIRVFDGKTTGGSKLINELNSGERPDLIITDHDMPSTDGIAVLKAAKNHGINAIMFTSTTDPSIEIQTQQLGAELCSKEHPDELCRMVERLTHHAIADSSQTIPPAKQLLQQALHTGIQF